MWSAGACKSLVFVGLEDIEALQFLIQDCERLEASRLLHLGFKPIFDFILSVVFQVLVYVIKVSAEHINRRPRASSLHGTIDSYLFSCSNVTISSLQIGQASCAPAAAGGAGMEVPTLSREIREVRSWVSVEN
jgi:hypothetical protein